MYKEKASENIGKISSWFKQKLNKNEESKELELTEKPKKGKFMDTVKSTLSKINPANKVKQAKETYNNILIFGAAMLSGVFFLFLSLWFLPFLIISPAKFTGCFLFS